MIDSPACRSVSLVVIALLSPLARGAMLSSSPRAEATRPNIIFLLVDDLGYGDIGGYGVTDIRTPQLDRLAQDGVKLTDCYANGPVCSATRAAFITGRYQQRAGFERAISPWEKDPGLPVSETSIAKPTESLTASMFSRFWLKKNPFENARFFGALSGQRRTVAEDKKLFAKGIGNISRTTAGPFCSISSRISQNGGTCVINIPRCLPACAPS